MSLLIVVGLVLAWSRRPILAIASVGAVVLAGLVKLTALALLPLLGIYLLRAADSWRDRLLIVVGSGIVTAAICLAVVPPVWVGPETFAVQTLGSGPDRYVNSLAEVALGELRRELGATTDDLEIPLQFSGWWVGVHTDTSLYSTRDGRDIAGGAAGLERAARRRPGAGRPPARLRSDLAPGRLRAVLDARPDRPARRSSWPTPRSRHAVAARSVPRT